MGDTDFLHYVLKNNDKTEVKYLYHLSDIHIRNDEEKYYAVYFEMFGKLYDKLKLLIGENKNESLIIITGDVLHAKLTYTPCSVTLLYNFFSELVKITSVILIAGNHDCNLSNINSMDSLTPFVGIINHFFESNKKNNNRLYYLKESGFYQYHNLVFGVSSLLDGHFVKEKTLNKSFFNDIKQTNKYKIALYHGSIYGSVTNKGYKCTHETINNSHFDGYNYVLLGDIHKFQFMNKEKTIGYAGSLIQQNFAESVKEHGILKWDLSKGTSKFYEIPNDYGYCVVNIDKGKIIDTYVPDKSEVRFKLSDTDIDQYRKARNIFQSEHNECKLETMCNLQSMVKTSSLNDYLCENGILNDLIKDDMHISKIEKFLEKKKTDPILIGSLIKLHKEIYNKCVMEGTDNKKICTSQPWKLLELEFSNMMSYGENNVLNFEQYESNKIIGILAGNGFGKSSIIDIILFCLFEEQTRGDRDDVVNYNNNNNEMRCSIKFKIGEDVYKIVRHGTPKIDKRGKKNFSVKVEFYSIHKDNRGIETLVSIAGKNKSDTDNKIKALLGKYDDYVTSSIRLQSTKKNQDFIEMTRKSRSKYLQTILKFNVFEQCLDEVTKRINKLKGERKSVDKFMNMEDNNIVVIQKKIDETKSALKRVNNELHNCESIHELYNSPGAYDNELSNINFVSVGDLSKYNINFRESSSVINEKFIELIDLNKSKLRESSQLLNQSKIDNNIKNIKQEMNTCNSMLSSFQRKRKKLTKQLRTIMPMNIDINELMNKQKEFTKTIKNNLKLLSNYNIVYDDNDFVNNYEICEIIKNEIMELEEIIQEQCETIGTSKDLLMNTIDNHKSFAKHVHKIINQIEKIINEEMSAKAAKVLQKISNTNKEWTENNNNYIDDLHHKINNMNIDDIKTKLKARKKDLKNINSLIKDNKSLNDNLRFINENIRQYNLQLDQEEKNVKIQKKIDDILIEEKKLKNNIDKYDQILNNHNDFLNIKNNLIDEFILLEKNYLLFMSWASSKDKCKNRIKTIEKFKTEIDILRQNKIQYKSDLKHLKELYNNSKDWNNKQILVENTMKLYNEYESVIGYQGVPYEIIKGSLPIIRKEVNEVLSKLTNFYVDFISIDPESDDNTIINQKLLYNVDIYINYPDGLPIKVDVSSGFEKFIVDLAIRIALSRLSLVARPNFFIIDEGWSCSDREKLNNIEYVIDYIRTLYDHVIIISHLDELKNQIDYSIVIDKNKNFSHVDNRPNKLRNNTNNKFKTSKSKTSKSKINGSKTNKSKSNRSKTNKSKTNKSIIISY